jgi:hypothetical protein
MASGSQEPDKNCRVSLFLIMVAILSCTLQLYWFATKCFNQMDFDGMAYAGIARHIRQAEFNSAINAFRSPLVSWLIAALSLASADYLHIGKLVSIGTFLLCLALLYAFVVQLWHSRLVASLAVLLFTFGRGLSVVAVALVTPDFLFASLVLIYFITLLRCFRAGGLQNWLFLGGIHGLAFLAKAFALPWLGLCTVVAVALSQGAWKTKAAWLSCAALVPLIVAGGWATVLHSKYDVYTTGSQFKTNLLQWTLHEYPQHRESTYALLRGTTKELDEYLVADPMPPGSWGWTYHATIGQEFPKLLLAEKSNVPKALKELTIVVTPGVLIAFLVTLAILTLSRHLYPVEWRIVAIISVSLFSLVLAYSMLVFDGRYLFPVIPLVLAVGARFLVADGRSNHSGWRRASIALVVLGVGGSLIYPSSPFRVLTRDFQVMSYQAGAILSRHPAATLVSIGSGPFPEHGVGWEAGYQAAYFGGDRLVATTDSLPSTAELSTVIEDLRKASPEVVIVWGGPLDNRYTALVQTLTLQYPYHQVQRITDPIRGEVGAMLFTAR